MADEVKYNTFFSNGIKYTYMHLPAFDDPTPTVHIGQGLRSQIDDAYRLKYTYFPSEYFDLLKPRKRTTRLTKRRTWQH